MFKWATRAAAVFVIGFTLLAAYWVLIDRQPPIEMTRGEILRYDEQPNGNWLLLVKWSAHRVRVCPGISRRWITGEAWLPLPDIMYPPEVQDAKLGDFSWEVVAEIPAYFAAIGVTEGQYRIEIRFACNPLQQYIFPILVVPEPIVFDLPIDSE